MAEILTREQIKRFLMVFCFYDYDGDSRIASTDLINVLRDLDRYPSEAELQELILYADPNERGYIDFREFICLMARIVAGGQSEFEETEESDDDNDDEDELTEDTDEEQCECEEEEEEEDEEEEEEEEDQDEEYSKETKQQSG